MNLNQLATEIHNLNKEKGFWDGKRNISEALFLIITEMSEAIEGHRKGKFAELERFENTLNNTVTFPIPLFELSIKDTFEDEIADTIIRALDLCGFYEISFFPQNTKQNFSNNVGGDLMDITSLIATCNVYLKESDFVNVKNLLNRLVNVLVAFSNNYKIDIEKHIQYKIQYNKTRPYLHGKKY